MRDASLPNSKISRRGFSLVELLVVIGIIALLIAMLLPALASSRRSAQLIKCAANLRTIGQAMNQCANEHRGYLPLAGTIYIKGGLAPATPSNIGDGSRQRYTYFDYDGGGNYMPTSPTAALAPYLGAATVRGDNYTDANADIQAPGPLQDAFLCPSDEPTINRTYGAGALIIDRFNNDALNGWSSYGFNAEALGWCDNGVALLSGHSRARQCRGDTSCLRHHAPLRRTR